MKKKFFLVLAMLILVGGFVFGNNTTQPSIRITSFYHKILNNLTNPFLRFSYDNLDVFVSYDQTHAFYWTKYGDESFKTGKINLCLNDNQFTDDVVLEINDSKIEIICTEIDTIHIKIKTKSVSECKISYLTEEDFKMHLGAIL